MKIGNFRLFERNIKKAREAILSGHKLVQQPQGDIELPGGLYASSSIGKSRQNQEDSVLLCTHPKDSDIKMMVVADGVGGNEAGEEASYLVITAMKEWFENLKMKKNMNTNELMESIEQVLNEVNEDINEKYSDLEELARPGSTIVCAIVLKKQTLVVNVGDSRAYIYKDNELYQISKDHTLIGNLVESNQIPRQYARFHKQNSGITRCIGGNEEPAMPTFTILKNDDYDALLLFSDGVTDCLSDEKILAVTRSTDRKYLAERLVGEALHTNSELPKALRRERWYNPIIKGGKDNTTAAVYYPDKTSKKTSKNDNDGR